MPISITLYEDEMNTLLSLPDDLKCKILTAILCNNLGKEVPTLDPAENAIYSLINAQIQRAKDLSNKRRDSANSRWKKGTNSESDNANDMQNNANTMQNHANGMQNDANLCTNTITSTKTITKTDTKSPPPPSKGEKGASDKKEQEQRFNRFWSAYPKKTAKQAAYKAWQKLKPDDELTDQILSALEKQKQSSQWQRDNGQYIPYPATWLNGRRWEDENIISNKKGFDLNENNLSYGGHSSYDPYADYNF